MRNYYFYIDNIRINIQMLFDINNNNNNNFEFILKKNCNIFKSKLKISANLINKYEFK